MKDEVNYEDFLRRLICAAKDDRWSDWDYIERILNTCLANHLLSETFVREIWDALPKIYIELNSFSTDFKKEMRLEL